MLKKLGRPVQLSPHFAVLLRQLVVLVSHVILLMGKLRGTLGGLVELLLHLAVFLSQLMVLVSHVILLMGKPRGTLGGLVELLVYLAVLLSQIVVLVSHVVYPPLCLQHGAAPHKSTHAQHAHQEKQQSN